MNGLLVGILLAAAGILTLLICAVREKRIMKSLSCMLEQAAGGDYTETKYDESRLSEIESRMVRFLHTSAISTRAAREERDRIQTLIADISHQTKTPISNILLYTELLGETALPEEGRIALEALKGQTEKLKFLIEALIKISRLENGIITVKPKRNSIDPMMEQIYGQIANRARAKAITVTLQKSGLQAEFDRKWTEEALYNLVDNAVKYTPKGGQVELSARSFELFVRIDVKDNGVGITEAEQAQIFSRFYRAGEVEEEGLGVGLFLARKIISLEGGYIRVISAKGKGALFSMYLPGGTP